MHMIVYLEKVKEAMIEKISMGAALRHLDICCKEKNIKIEYVKKNIKNKRKKEYFISIIDKNNE